MNNFNLTKEQINLYTVIGSAVLLIIFLFIPAGKVSFMGFSESFNMINFLNGAGFLLTIGAIFALLCPIYLILYSYKDNEALKSLKPIFVIDRKVAGIILAAAAVIIIIGLFATDMVSPAFGGWLYLIIAAAICYLGFIQPKAEEKK